MFRHLPLIFRNSLRNRRRSLLTIVSIAASLCLLGLLLALYRSFFLQEATPDQAMRLITRNRISLANPLSVSYLSRIRQVPGVREAMIFQWFGGTYKDARDPANFFARFAIEAEKLGVVSPDYRMPDDQREAFIREQSACIVGRRTAERHNLRIGERIQIDGDIYPVRLDLIIRGIFDNDQDNETLFFHYKYLNERFVDMPGLRDQVGTFTIRLERPEDAAAVSKAIDDQFRNAPMQTKTETEQAVRALELVGLGDRLNHTPRQLSGGQEQRVAIARAIVTDPDVILADEPTGNLDANSARDALTLLGRLNSEFGKTIVMVTHDPHAANAASHVRYLDKGALLEEGGKPADY